MEEGTAKFEGWAVVEMMGHQRVVGFVTTEHYGAAALFRVDTPELPERDFLLKQPEYVGGKWAPAGASVRRPLSPPQTKLVGPGSIYAITPCTEETALKAVENMMSRPLILLSIPENAKPLLVPGDLGEDICEDCGQSVDIAPVINWTIKRTIRKAGR